MAVYTITFTVPGESEEYSFQCGESDFLLDAAQENGFDWPYAGRAGEDPASAARLISGQVDQSEQTFLVDEQIAEGYILTDVGYPQSDCVLLIGQEENLDC